jgi:Secretion system C-terminal sorting domain
MKRNIALLVLFAVSIGKCIAQASDFPPINPYYATSNWPTYHCNNYRQASTAIKGPTSTDRLQLKMLKHIKGGTSCWTQFSEKYPTGQRVILLSNATHFHKILETKKGFDIIDSYKIDDDAFRSFGWNFLVAKNNVWFTYDPKYNPAKNEFTTLFKLTDEQPGNYRSKIKLIDTYNFGNMGKIQFYAINNRGEIMFYSDNDKGKRDIIVGVITQDFQLLDTLRIQSKKNEIAGHNSFPVDDDNSIYFQTTERFFKIDWNGKKLSVNYAVNYDFVNDGPTGKFSEGSGTTPTLIGTEPGSDKLVVLSDGHKQNNLVGFWRELPKDWKAIPGHDIHFAGSIAIPAAKQFSSLFQSVENSPCAYQYDIGIAQFNGFLGQKTPTIKGVQKIRWDIKQRKFKVMWVNDKININAVLSYSKGSNLVYGSGKEDDCSFYYYGLDWETGEVKLRFFMGNRCRQLFNEFDDGGNGNTIDENGNIYFAGGGSLLKIEKNDSNTTADLIENSRPLSFNATLFPNPTSGIVNIKIDTEPKRFDLSLYDSKGGKLLQKNVEGNQTQWNLSALSSGIYNIKIEGTNIEKKIMRSNKKLIISK